MLSFTTIDGRIYRTSDTLMVKPIWNLASSKCKITCQVRFTSHAFRCRVLVRWFHGTYYVSGKPYLFSKLLAINNLRIHSLANLVTYLGKLTKIIYFYNTQTKREKRYQTQQSSSWLWTQWKTISCTYSFYTWWKPWDFLKVSTAFNIKNF